jgi:hypothetical protein
LTLSELVMEGMVSATRCVIVDRMEEVSDLQGFEAYG